MQLTESTLKRGLMVALITSLTLGLAACNGEDDEGNDTGMVEDTGGDQDTGTVEDTGGDDDTGMAGDTGGDDTGMAGDTGEADTGDMDGGMATTTRVQVIHNSADPAASTVDVFANGELLIDDFEFRTATPFVDVPAGVGLTIAIAGSDAADGTDDTTLDEDETAVGEFGPLTLDEEKSYIVVAEGVVNSDNFADNPDGEDVGLDLKVYDQARESADDSTMADVLLHHGITDAPAVDVTVDRAEMPQVTDLAYGSFAGYVSLAPTLHTVDVQVGDLATLNLQTPDLPEGGAFTVVASGFVTPDDNESGPAAGFFAYPATTQGDGRIQGIELGEAARLQAIHASYDSNASEVDVYINDEKVVDNFQYGSATPFVSVPAGVDLTIDLTATDAADNSDPAFSKTVTGGLSPGIATVAVAAGVLGDDFDLFTSAAVESASSGNVDLKVFHGAEAPNVDVAAGGNVLVGDLGFGNFSTLQTLPATDISGVEIRPAGQMTAVATFDVPLSMYDGNYLTVVAHGTLDDEDQIPFAVTAFTVGGAAANLTP